MKYKNATSKKPLIENRIRDFHCLGKKYFSDTFGFFTVKKAWRVSTFHERSEPHVTNSIKVEIKTPYGRIVDMTHHFNPVIWDQEY